MIAIDTDILAQLNESELKMLLVISKKIYEEKTSLIPNKELAELCGFSMNKMKYTRVSLEEKRMISRGPNKGKGINSRYEITTLLVVPDHYLQY